MNLPNFQGETFSTREKQKAVKKIFIVIITHFNFAWSFSNRMLIQEVSSSALVDARLLYFVCKNWNFPLGNINLYDRKFSAFI